MDDAGNVTENGQEQVDEEVGAAATLEEDSERWEEDGEDDLDDVAVRLLLALRITSRRSLVVAVAIAFGSRAHPTRELAVGSLPSGERHGDGGLVW